MDDARISDFIKRWGQSGAAERANCQAFLSELCDLLGVARPDPSQPDDSINQYVFERNVTFQHSDGTTSTGRIDLYKRGCFILEAKQGAEKQEKAEALAAATAARAKALKRGTATRGSAAWDEAMLRARGQAEQYARALPGSEGRPPFLLVVDVGHSLELYSEFTRTGGAYVAFPNSLSHRLFLSDLAKPDVRERLRQVWTDPLALDPSRRSAKVTLEIAQQLGKLAKSLEVSGHAPELVAAFLMRALFTMFAEDVELLPPQSFRDLLESRRGRLSSFVPTLEDLWQKMNTGGFSTALDADVLRFNGGLFADCKALPLNEDQFEMLVEAARADWREVEPAIFGTLLERALSPQERHKLGAHYTPRAYVERLVIPTIVEPLRAEWDAAKAAAVTLDRAGKDEEAIAEVQRFHRRLCEIRVLDPACGSGNFLYVTLEHLKRLEGEVIEALNDLGHKQGDLELESFSVLPKQLLGIEVNPRAAAIAELVLWIGHLQWHFRTYGKKQPPQPIIKAFRNIECRDAVLTYDGTQTVLDDFGNPVTRWDGRSTKTSPVTGDQIPDESARTLAVQYINPRKPQWPDTDFVVGNPPFIGTKRMRYGLGDDYVEALRRTYGREVEDNADFVMYWWNNAAQLLQAGKIRRFGLITTNSISQSFNRRVLTRWLERGLKIVYAIPDHPWTDSESAAAVRIAMTVAETNRGQSCTRSEVVAEFDDPSNPREPQIEFSIQTADSIHADLNVGPDITKASPLSSNIGFSGMGVALHGSGFIIDPETASKLRSLGPSVIKPYLGGSDLVRERRERFIIDFSFMSEAQAQAANTRAFQHVIDHIRPERIVNRRESIRKYWWRFGWERPAVRRAIASVSRYIGTTETSKHRIFQFVDATILPDHMIVVIATQDGFHLGVLSSDYHVRWALAAGGTLEDRPRYNKSVCFDTYPFPNIPGSAKINVRALGEVLDAHRKRQQELNPGLTLTDMYNVLEKLRAEEPLNEKDQLIHEQGLVSVLRQIHDDLDAAVAEAYGWGDLNTAQAEARLGSFRDFQTGAITTHDPASPDFRKALREWEERLDAEILTRLVELNAERAAEERRGLIRWLRPEFQNPSGATTQTGFDTGETDETPTITTPAAKRAWPKPLAEQVQTVRAILVALGVPSTAKTVAGMAKGAQVARVTEILETLVALGQARAVPGGYFVPA